MDDLLIPPFLRYVHLEINRIKSYHVLLKQNDNRCLLHNDDDGAHAIGYATDTGYISDGIRTALLGCDAVVLECNHDVDMLLRGPYPPDLKQRILSRYGHLSNESGAEFARFLADNGTTHLMLAHISEINNTPELARKASVSALSDVLDRVELAVCEPAEPVIFTL